MHRRIIACALALLAMTGTASAEILRQYKLLQGTSLYDLLQNGYEIKAVLRGEQLNYFDYFLQKGATFVMCRQGGTYLGGKEVFSFYSCSEVTKPYEIKPKEEGRAPATDRPTPGAR
jgi:hypothetical protein